MSTLYPTIVLGIGTFGGNVVNLLRTLIYEELNQPGLPIFRFIHISSHAENEFDPQPSNNVRHNAWELMHTIRCTQAFEDTQRIRKILKLERRGTFKEGIQEQGWKNWLDDSLLSMPIQDWEKGAGNIRMIGRCLLWNNWRRKAMVQAKLSNYIQEITNDVEVIRKTNDIISQYYHRKEGQPPAHDINYVHTLPQIYLICSMCGGTGSGMFLDLAYFFRNQAAQDLHISGTFSIPDTATCNDPGKGRLAANALAGLIELDYYMTEGTRYQEQLPLESRLTDSDEKPFDFVKLISPRSINGKALGKAPVPNEETLDELAHIAASSLFFEMLSGTEVRKAAIQVGYGAPDELMTAKSDDNDFLRGMSTFGAATAHYPKYRIASAAACQIIEERILAWSGRVVNFDRVTGVEEKQRNKFDGLSAKHIATKWFQTANQRAQERFCLGENGTKTIRNGWMSEFDTIFFQKMTPKESDFRTLRDQMKFAPQGNPLVNRFVAGGRYAKLLEGRLDGLREAMLDSLKEIYSSALTQIVSDEPIISAHMPQDLEHLQEVVLFLCGDVIREAQNKLPIMPTQPVSLSKMDNIFAESERAERSAAVWMVGARNAVREYYRRLILNHYQMMLQKANLDMELAFLGRVLPDLKNDLDRGIRNINTSMMSKIGLCIKYLQERSRNLTRAFNYENMVLVVTDRQKGIEHDTQLCRNTFRANMWKEIFAEMQQLDGNGRSIINLLIDPKSDHKSIVTRLIDLMVRKLMGRMEGGRPFDIVETLLSDYRLELFTMGKRSLVLLELTPAYRDIFAGNHPRLIYGGDPNEVKRLTTTLNQEDIHDFDSAKIVRSSVNHMLHLYQEQAGMAVEDLQAYKSMHEHYRTYNRIGPVAYSDARFLHTDRDISRFDKQIYRRITDLKHSPGVDKPSPFTIATEILADQLFTFRPISNTEDEMTFEWIDHGIERYEIYDPKNPEMFLRAIARSVSAYLSFKQRVVTLINKKNQSNNSKSINDKLNDTEFTQHTNIIDNDSSTIQIELHLSYDFRMFNKDRKKQFLESLKSFLLSDAAIQIIKTESGSTKVTIELSRKQAEQLLWLHKRGVLDELNVQDAKLICDAAISALIEEKVNDESFDVFLCHNSEDKPEVKKIAIDLRKQGILPWFDEWELRPGLPWQRILESKIKSIKSAAVFIGAKGIGPWQNLEVDSFIRHFVNRSCPVIPVMLRTCNNKPDLPIFLEGMTWVCLQKRNPDPIYQLIWGITGKRIERY